MLQPRRRGQRSGQHVIIDKWKCQNEKLTENQQLQQQHFRLWGRASKRLRRAADN